MGGSRPQAAATGCYRATRSRPRDRAAFGVSAHACDAPAAETAIAWRLCAKKQVKFVQECLCLAGYGVKVDGDFGPATAQQIKNFSAKKSGLAVSGGYGTKEHELLTAPFVKAVNPFAGGGQKLGGMIVAVARQHIKQRPREVGSDNCGPWVRVHMDGNDGEEWKWCAGFCFFAIEQACSVPDRLIPMKKSFTVDTIVDRAKSANQFLIEQKARSVSGKASIVPGSLFVVRAAGDAPW